MSVLRGFIVCKGVVWVRIFGLQSFYVYSLSQSYLPLVSRSWIPHNICLSCSLIILTSYPYSVLPPQYIPNLILFHDFFYTFFFFLTLVAPVILFPPCCLFKIPKRKQNNWLGMVMFSRQDTAWVVYIV